VGPFGKKCLLKGSLLTFGQSYLISPKRSHKPQNPNQGPHRRGINHKGKPSLGNPLKNPFPIQTRGIFGGKGLSTLQKENPGTFPPKLTGGGPPLGGQGKLSSFKNPPKRQFLGRAKWGKIPPKPKPKRPPKQGT